MSNVIDICREIKYSSPKVASQMAIAAEVEDELIFDTLQDLLQDECLQRDVYEAYDYLLLGPEDAVREHIAEHLEEEMEHIRVLQRYLVANNYKPTTIRKEIPSIDLSFEGILRANLKLEEDAVSKYTAAIIMLEGMEKFTALRVDLENTLSQEQEHTHDLQIWLKRYSEIND